MVQRAHGLPHGHRVGAPVVTSYRLPNGKTAAVIPLEVADLHDHPSATNADHDLCLPRLPRDAKLTGMTIGSELIQDPNGDPNTAQKFRAKRQRTPLGLLNTPHGRGA